MINKIQVGATTYNIDASEGVFLIDGTKLDEAINEHEGTIVDTDTIDTLKQIYNTASAGTKITCIVRWQYDETVVEDAYSMHESDFRILDSCDTYQEQGTDFENRTLYLSNINTSCYSRDGIETNLNSNNLSIEYGYMQYIDEDTQESVIEETAYVDHYRKNTTTRSVYTPDFWTMRFYNGTYSYFSDQDANETQSFYVGMFTSYCSNYTYNSAGDPAGEKNEHVVRPYQIPMRFISFDDLHSNDTRLYYTANDYINVQFSSGMYIVNNGSVIIVVNDNTATTSVLLLQTPGADGTADQFVYTKIDLTSSELNSAILYNNIKYLATHPLS